MPAAHSAFGLYLLGFTVALAGSILLTYLVRDIGRRAKLLDPCDDRKLHEHPVPRIGGVAIFLAVALALLAVEWWSELPESGLLRGGLPVILAGGFLIHLLGLLDDIRPIRARWKFLLQILIALGVFFAGVQVTRFTLPFAGSVELGQFLGMVFTVAWLVGITNAFNLIDGLDGLASGAALFALIALFVVASIYGQEGAAILTIVLAGATLGFLFFNFHPASIFLGDSGSLFLGFMLAGVGLLSSQKSPTAIAVAIPVVSLGLPVLDTTLAIVRRFLRGQPIFTPDRGHIHHRLLGLGHSPKKVALLLYAACALLALGGMLLVNEGNFVAFVLIVVGMGVGLAVQRLRFYEFQELGRMLRNGVRQREVIGRRVRIREASVRLAELDDLETVFDLLERTFTDDLFHRAEVRLRVSFLEEDHTLAPLDRRRDDELPVWTWSRNGAAHPEWWEIKLPLLSNCRPIGSLVLWQDGASVDTGLSHIYTIAAELRQAVEAKISAMWHVPGLAVAGSERLRVVEQVAIATAEGLADRPAPHLAVLSEKGRGSLREDGGSGNRSPGARRSVM